MSWGPYAEDGLIGSSPALLAVLKKAVFVAPLPWSVLIMGPKGSGKELLARLIHSRSGRRGPFLAVNCAGITPDLAVAELFGYEKGAFTGASEATAGLFELAHGGTLFLDEVAELPREPQGMLLRVTQEKEIRRVGSRTAKPTKVDVRIICGTLDDLPRLAEDGLFRDDLLDRIGQVKLRLPPLDHRGADVVTLAQWMLQRDDVFKARGLELAPDAPAWLRARRWPGNVRELYNVLVEAFILGEGRPIDAALLEAVAGDASSLEVDDTSTRRASTSDTEPSAEAADAEVSDWMAQVARQLGALRPAPAAEWLARMEAAELLGPLAKYPPGGRTVWLGRLWAGLVGRVCGEHQLRRTAETGSKRPRYWFE